MAFDYARSAQTSARLLARFGQMGALRRQTAGPGSTYDPGEPTNTDYAVNMAVIKYSDREIDGTRILASDLKVLVAPEVEIEPLPSDLLVLADGRTLAIVTVTPLSPAGTVVLWTIQARSA